MTIVRLVIGALAVALGVVLGPVLRRLGFTIFRPTPICEDGGAVGCGSNPRQCGTSRAIVFDPAGNLAEFPECGPGPSTVMVASEGGLKGLDASARAELMFAPVSEVEVMVMHFGHPGQIEAFEMSGIVAATVMMGPAANVEQRFTLRGTGIGRIVVTPGTPTDHTLVLGWCH
jgi:hypothetical protein